MMVLEEINSEDQIKWKKVGKESVHLDQECYRMKKLPNSTLR